MLRDSVGSRLVTEAILDFIYPHLSPVTSPMPPVTVGWSANGGPPWLPDTSTLSSPYFINSSTVVLVPSVPLAPQVTPAAQQPLSRWAEWTQPDRVISSRIQTTTVPLCSSEAFRQIGHSMFTLLVAVLGATYSRHRYRVSRTDSPGSESAS
jgi:hypothetical protein